MDRYALEGLDEFEDLGVATLMEKRTDAARTGDYDSLREYSDKVISAQQEAAPSDDSLPQDTELADEENGEELDQGDPDDTEDDGSAEDKTSIAAESLRDEYYDRLALEEFSQSSWSVSGFAGEQALKLIRVLKELGISYSPVVYKMIRTGVLYMFTKSVMLTLKMLIAIPTWMKANNLRLSKRSKDIEKLRKEIERIKGVGIPVTLEGKRCTDVNILRWFTIRTGTNPSKTADIMNRFISEVVKDLDAGMKHDVSVVRKLIDISESGIRGNLLTYLKVQPFSTNFLRRAVRGYNKTPGLTESYVYKEDLPDATLFVANVPRSDLKEEADISKAYQSSGMFLAVDDHYRPVSDGIDYMDIQELSKFLDVLEELCNTAITHKAFFMGVLSEAESLKFGYKHYYQKLVESKEQSTIRSSLVEYVYQKQSYVTRVYAPAAMDVHTYVTSFLLKAVRFARQNVAALS